MTEKWYSKNSDDIAKILKTNAASGLSPEAAKSRLRKQGINSVFIVSHVSAWQYTKEVLGDLTTVLLVITAGVAAVFEGKNDAYAIWLLLILSCVCEVATYIKAHRILERTAAYSIPVARVLRGGNVHIIDSRNVVVGDIILLEAGEAVPCDCRIISCDNLSVGEAGIVSERDISKKNADVIKTSRDLYPEDMSNMLFGGSVIASGSAKAVAVEIGEDTLVYAVRGGIPVSEPEKMPIIKKLKKYCHVVSLAMIFAVLAITFLDLILGLESRGLGSIFMMGISLAVASMSEFFTAIGYIIIACSVVGRDRDENKHGAIIKNTGILKSLGNAECVMMKDDIILRSGVKKVKGFYFDGQMHPDAEKKESELELIKLLSLCLLSLGRIGVHGMVAAGDSQPLENSDIDMIGVLYGKLLSGGVKDEYKNKFQMIGHASVGGSSRHETTLALKVDDDYYAYSFGDLPGILADCVTYKSNGKKFILDKEKRREIFDEAFSLEKASCRIVAVGSRESPYNNMKRASVLQSDLCFEGFVGIIEPMTSDGAQIISAFRKADIKLVMITDSIGISEKYFAVSAGFISYDDDGGYITGKEFKEKFKGKKASEIDVSRYTVLAGFDSEDKLKFLEAEKYVHKTVYAGSGKGDTSLIAKSDAGMACSSLASQTARVSADVLIEKADEDSGGIHDVYSAVCEAKNIYFNLKHAASYLITSQTARLILVLCSVIFKLNILAPQQILAWGLIFDFAAVLIMAFEKPKSGVISEKISKHTPLSSGEMAKSALFGFFWAVVTVAVPVIAKVSEIEMSDESLKGCIFVSSVITLLVAATECTSEKSIFAPGITINLAYILFVLLVGAVVILCVVSDTFVMYLGLAKLDWITLLLSLIPAVAIFLMYEISKKLKY